MLSNTGSTETVVKYVSPAGNSCHFVLLDNDESCPTADRSNIGWSNGQTYQTGELLNTAQINTTRLVLSDVIRFWFRGTAMD